MDHDELLRVLEAFADEGREYVLIGAAAMGLHGVVRATEDLALFVRPTQENVERLKRAFRTVYGDDPDLDEIRPTICWVSILPCATIRRPGTSIST